MPSTSIVTAILLVSYCVDCLLYKFSHALASKQKCPFAGTCAVLVTDNGKNRSLVADLSAANCFTQDHIKKPENQALIKDAEIFYISVSCL